MKKIVFVLLITTSVLKLYSQDSKKVSAGLFISPNLSWLKSDLKAVENEGIKMGYSFGALLDLKVVDNFYFSAGLAYKNMGGKLSYEHGISEFKTEDSTLYNVQSGTTIKYKLDYLSIPLALKGTTNEIGYITYFLKAGIEPMINIGAKADIGNIKNYVIKKDNINFFNFGWNIGGGFEYNLVGNTKLLVEILYTGFILDVDKSKDIFIDAAAVQKKNPKTVINEIELKVGILF